MSVTLPQGSVRMSVMVVANLGQENIGSKARRGELDSFSQQILSPLNATVFFLGSNKGSEVTHGRHLDQAVRKQRKGSVKKKREGVG